ncbi:hypothetical protein FHW79_006308 [Azospirillum sp. OGB3]|uniref:replication initiation protein n=1 Tax=Azospirillum TaxID=191 RepID=UPI001589EA55|nr:MULTISPECIES: replication initiation protein [Azospirillum]MBB3268633.1 hypothetical protein [Azospirillum sp. OGB3]
MKVRELIEVLDPDLSVVDRKLLDAMLAHASDTVLSDAVTGVMPPGTRIYSALATDVKRAMGWESHKSNTRILTAAKNLQSSVITIGYFAPGDATLRHRNISLITLSEVPESQGVIYWRFSPEVEKLLSMKGERFLVQLKVLAKLTSGYSHRLYQLLCANTDRETLSWTVSVGDLRQVLNAAAESYDKWAAFERRVLRVAVDEINEHAAFNIRYELVLQERTKKRTHIRFIFEGPASALPPAETETFLEEPTGQFVFNLPAADVSMPPPATVAGKLGNRVRSRYREQFPGAPIDELIDLWANWCVRHRIRTERPPRIFERWLNTVFGDLAAEASEGDASVWSAAFSRDLDQPVYRVMFALGGMVARQRQLWLTLAKSKHGDKYPSRKMPTVSLDCADFYLWVPLIQDEFLKANPV